MHRSTQVYHSPESSKNSGAQTTAYSLPILRRTSSLESSLARFLAISRYQASVVASSPASSALGPWIFSPFVRILLKLLQGSHCLLLNERPILWRGGLELADHIRRQQGAVWIAHIREQVRHEMISILWDTFNTLLKYVPGSRGELCHPMLDKILYQSQFRRDSTSAAIRCCHMRLIVRIIKVFLRSLDVGLV